MISKLGFEGKLTKDGEGPEKWDDRCDGGKRAVPLLLLYVTSKQE